MSNYEYIIELYKYNSIIIHFAEKIDDVLVFVEKVVTLRPKSVKR